MTARKSILIVEDDALTLERLRSQLEADGYGVRTATDGEAGLCAIRAERPDLVITDLLLPKLNGFELVKALRGDAALADLPLILITAFYGREEIDQNLQATIAAEEKRRCPVLYKPVQAHELLSQVRAQLEGTPPVAHPGYVLVIDDDRANLELIERRLEVEDYAVATAENGAAGIERLLHERFDAVLLDLRLPDIDGLAVFARIRAFNTDVPVIIMTAHGSESLAVKALTEGAADYLIKPIGRKELTTALRNAIERARLQGEKRQIQANLLETMVALNQSKHATEREHRRMVGLLRSLDEGVVLLDSSGRIELMNPAACALLGLSRPVLDRSAFFERIVEVQAEDGRVFSADQLGHETMHHLTSVECVVRWTDGREQAFSVTSQPFDVTKDSPGGWVVLFRDVTERRGRRLRLEQLLRTQSETLDRANERQAREVAKATEGAEQVKNEILSAVSHELRTPLNFIIGFGSILAEGLEGDLTPRQHELVEKMLMGAERLTRTIEDLLDYSMLTTGMLRPACEPIPLSELAQDAVSENEQAAEAAGLRLRMAPDPTPVVPLGDVGFTRKIVRELVTNALKFTPAGGEVVLALTATPRSVALEVRDKGIGIEPDVLPHIFGRFYQGESQSTRRFGGTGMGLALAKGLAELMGAHLEVESVPGQGSTFRLAWPILSA